jgi:hypothetical protein
MRLAVALLRLLGMIDSDSDSDNSSASEQEKKQLWRLYADRVLPRVNERKGANAGVLWDAKDVEELQLEQAVEDIKALKSRMSLFRGVVYVCARAEFMC